LKDNKINNKNPIKIIQNKNPIQILQQQLHDLMSGHSVGGQGKTACINMLFSLTTNKICQLFANFPQPPQFADFTGQWEPCTDAQTHVCGLTNVLCG